MHRKHPGLVSYVRLLAWLQIVAAACLGAAVIAATINSSRLVHQLLGSLGDASAAARRTVTNAARQIELQHEPVSLAAASLEAFQQTLQAIKSQGADLIDLLPAYQKNVSGISQWMSHLEWTLAGTASAINVAVPDGINFRAGWTRPGVTYARPLAVPAQHLRETAEQLSGLRESLARTDAAVSNAHQQVKPRFLRSCDQAFAALSLLAQSANAIPAQLDQSGQDLATIAARLESVEKSIPAWEILIRFALVVAGLLAAVFAINGTVVLLTLTMRREGTSIRDRGNELRFCVIDN